MHGGCFTSSVKPGFLVVSISGVQGTGKTTLARALAVRLEAAFVPRDPLMAVLVQGGLPSAGLPEPRIEGVGPLGYQLQTAMMREQLTVGRSVVLECVAPVWLRDRWWRAAALDLGASFSTVECVCSDPREHRRRVDSRRAASAEEAHPSPSWQQVEETMQWYEGHPGAVFVADSMAPLDSNVSGLLEALAHEGLTPS